MREFDYLEPTSIGAATDMLVAHNENCRMIAGGTALMLALRQRMIAPTHLISLRRLRELRGITYDESVGLRIGAFTLHAEIARSPLVAGHFPMLADTAARLANPQVRNQGTIGGNLCYGDPATDPPTCLMAMDASVILTGPRGDRRLKLEDFLLDYFTTALGSDEMLREIRIPPPSFNAGTHVRFLRTAAEHRPLVNLAVTAKRDGDVCHDIRLVVGASTVTPTRAGAAEAFLAGKVVTARVATKAADLVASEIKPISDLRGDAAYRRDMVRVVARRTIEDLFVPSGAVAS